MTVAQIAWTIAVVVFLVLELATPSMLVSIWFMAGALAALLVSLFCPVVWVQLLVFVAVTALTLLFTRPLVVRKNRTPVVHTNADAVIGMHGRVTRTVLPDEGGRVQVNGLSWAARCAEELPVGSRCVVDAIEGATLKVHRDTRSPEETVNNKEDATV